MRLAVWSPLPPSSSGIADYVLEALPHLQRHAEVCVVVEEAPPVGVLPPGIRVIPAGDAYTSDLDLYHLGNSPPHAFVYRAALSRPGIAFLHEWSLHHLVLKETVEKGDVSTYLKEMRRAHGEAGSFVGRQVARALGGSILPALFPLNDRILENCLGVVGLTRYVTSKAARRLPGRDVLHLPHHLALPPVLPTRGEAREALSLPKDALIVTAPGLATAQKRLFVAFRALGRLRAEFPSLRVVVAGAVDPGLPLEAVADEAGLREALIVTGRLTFGDFIRHLCAADLILGLRFPSHGEISGALVRALGVGRPALVTAGTPASEEFPEGVVIPVDPGPFEALELEAFLRKTLGDPALREGIGALAAQHVRVHNGIEATVDTLVAFLEGVLEKKDRLLQALNFDRVDEATLLGRLMEEVRWAARDLGLSSAAGGEKALIEELTGR